MHIWMHSHDIWSGIEKYKMNRNDFDLTYWRLDSEAGLLQIQKTSFLYNSLHFARISENNQNFITVNLSDSVDLFWQFLMIKTTNWT